jgi:PAS domain S-box-containing protein
VQTRPIGLRKDGSSFYADVHGTPFTYKGQPHALAIVRDVTKQVQAEEQLREKEEQYRSIFEAVTDSLSIARLEDGQIVEVNPAQCKMFGYTYEEMIGLTPAALVHPDSLPLMAKGLQRFMAEGRSDPPQMVLLRKDGTSFLNEAHSTRFTYKGKPHLLTISRDITERVEAEQQLREREEQYRSIFEATYDGLIISNIDGYIVEVNPAFCSMYGYTRDELVGVHSSALAAPEYLPALDEVLKTFKTERNYQTVVAQSLRKDGTRFYTESHGTSLTYRGKPHILGVVRDITERLEAEQQLREKEVQYRSIFEASTDALLIGDLEEGYVVEANPAVCQVFGYSYEEFIGLGPNDITPLDYQHLPIEARSTIKGGGQFQTQGAVALRKDGTTFYVDAHTTPFTYKGKLHQLAAVRDVTERVEAEKQMREKEDQYRGIFEATYDALFIMDLDGFLVEVNPAFCRMFGYPYEEVIGLHSSVFAAPVSLPSLAESLKALKTGRDIQTQVGQGLRKNGTAFYNEAHSTTLTYRGNPTHSEWCGTSPSVWKPSSSCVSAKSNTAASSRVPMTPSISSTSMGSLSRSIPPFVTCLVTPVKNSLACTQVSPPLQKRSLFWMMP